MHKLARTIAKELKTAKHCAVYRQELTRVWPGGGRNREQAVREFAQKHGWRLRFYNDELCAIFDKQPTTIPRWRAASIDERAAPG